MNLALNVNHQFILKNLVVCLLGALTVSVVEHFQIHYSVFVGKTESFPGALGGGEEEAPGRKEEAAQRGQA